MAKLPFNGRFSDVISSNCPRRSLMGRHQPLIFLLPAFKLSDAHVIALTHARKGLPVRTRSFMKFLQERFQPSPPWRQDKR